MSNFIVFVMKLFMINIKKDLFRTIRPTLLVCAGPPGRCVLVDGYPGFADPSGELQPGLLHEQALRAVCNFFRLLKHIDISSTANDRCCKQPGGSVHVIAQAEAPRRGKRSLGKRQTTHPVPEGRHKPIPLATLELTDYSAQGPKPH